MMLDKSNLLELYRIVANEEVKFLEMHQNRLKFFAGIISALVGGTVVGLFRSTVWLEYAFMPLGPLMLIIVAHIGQGAVLRVYQRFLETVTMRAKLEQLMGLTEVPQQDTSWPEPYWTNEPILAPRHLENRRAYPSSEQFINDHLGRGFEGWVIRLFKYTQIFGIVLLVIVVILVVVAACCPEIVARA